MQYNNKYCHNLCLGFPESRKYTFAYQSLTVLSNKAWQQLQVEHKIIWVLN